MSSQIIRDYEKSMIRKDMPRFKPGDRLRVSLKIVEGDKERLQDFEGDVIRRKGSGISETVTLRKVNHGVGIERIIPLNSPKVEKIQVVRYGRVRRAKLYYIRDLSGKAARIREQKIVYGAPLPGERKTRKERKAEAELAAQQAQAPVAAPAPEPTVQQDAATQE